MYITVERVSLAFQDKLYHVSEESNQWHLADYETDTQQSFDSADELLENPESMGNLYKKDGAILKRLIRLFVICWLSLSIELVLSHCGKC